MPLPHPPICSGTATPPPQSLPSALSPSLQMDPVALQPPLSLSPWLSPHQFKWIQWHCNHPSVSPHPMKWSRWHCNQSSLPIPWIGSGGTATTPLSQTLEMALVPSLFSHTVALQPLLSSHYSLTWVDAVPLVLMEHKINPVLALKFCFKIIFSDCSMENISNWTQEFLQTKPQIVLFHSKFPF